MPPKSSLRLRGGDLQTLRRLLAEHPGLASSPLGGPAASLRKDGAVAHGRARRLSTTLKWCDTRPLARRHNSFGSNAWTSQHWTPVLPRMPSPLLLVLSPGSSCLHRHVRRVLGKRQLHRARSDALWVRCPVRSRLDRTTRPATPASVWRAEWKRVVLSGELANWEDAWRAEDGPKDTFQPELLEGPSVAVLAAYHNDAVVAGAIPNCGATVVDSSNVFVGPGADLDPWPVAYMDRRRWCRRSAPRRNFCKVTGGGFLTEVEQNSKIGLGKGVHDKGFAGRVIATPSLGPDAPRLGRRWAGARLVCGVYAHGAANGLKGLVGEPERTQAWHGTGPIGGAFGGGPEY